MSNNADESYLASSKITLPLIHQIVTQSDDLPTTEDVKEARSKTLSHVKEAENLKFAQIKSAQEVSTQRLLGDVNLIF